MRARPGAIQYMSWGLCHIWVLVDDFGDFVVLVVAGKVVADKVAVDKAIVGRVVVGRVVVDRAVVGIVVVVDLAFVDFGEDSWSFD